MELGITTFAETYADPTTGRVPSHGERLRDLLEEVEVAEQVGLDVYGVGEHHRADFAASAPAVVLAAAAARTSRIRLTSAVTVLQLGGPGADVPGLRHAGPAVVRPGGDHRRARLVHRVVPAVRPEPGRLRRAVRREARAAARAARRRAGHLVGALPARAHRPGGLPAARAGPAARLGRRRRQPAVGRPGRPAGAADGAGHHRRLARALRPAGGAAPAGARAGGARAAAARRARARVRRRDVRAGGRATTTRRTRRR